MSNETLLLWVLAIIGVAAAVICLIWWIKARRQLAAEELASLVQEATAIEAAATKLSAIKPVVDPLCVEMTEAESALAAADVNLLKCDTAGGNKGIAWPVLLASVELAEKHFDRAEAAVNAHQPQLDELRIDLSDCGKRLWSTHSSVRTSAARSKWSELCSRESELFRALPNVPHIDWMAMKDKALPQDVVARVRARQTARLAAEEDRRRRFRRSCN